VEADDGRRDQLLLDLEALFLQVGRMAGSVHHGPGAESGFTPTQFMMLAWLAHHDGAAPMSELADALGISMAGATGVVDRLVHAGAVARDRSEEDRRLVLVALTDMGRDRIEWARHQAFLRFRRLTESISVADLEALTRILRVIVEKVRQEGERRSDGAAKHAAR
jgi:DNA-binding MarR family transcriptional regulator